MSVADPQTPPGTNFFGILCVMVRFSFAGGAHSWDNSRGCPGHAVHRYFLEEGGPSMSRRPPVFLLASVTGFLAFLPWVLAQPLPPKDIRAAGPEVPKPGNTEENPSLT